MLQVILAFCLAPSYFSAFSDILFIYYNSAIKTAINILKSALSIGTYYGLYQNIRNRIGTGFSNVT